MKVLRQGHFPPAACFLALGVIRSDVGRRFPLEKISLALALGWASVEDFAGARPGA
jgi:hypothetical protein